MSNKSYVLDSDDECSSPTLTRSCCKCTHTVCCSYCDSINLANRKMKTDAKRKLIFQNTSLTFRPTPQRKDC